MVLGVVVIVVAVVVVVVVLIVVVVVVVVLVVVVAVCTMIQVSAHDCGGNTSVWELRPGTLNAVVTRCSYTYGQEYDTGYGESEGEG